MGAEIEKSNQNNFIINRESHSPELVDGVKKNDSKDDWRWINNNALNNNGLTAIKNEEYKQWNEIAIKIRNSKESLKLIGTVIIGSLFIDCLVSFIAHKAFAEIVFLEVMSTLLLLMVLSPFIFKSITDKNAWNNFFTRNSKNIDDLMRANSEKFTLMNITIPTGVKTETRENISKILNILKKYGLTENYNKIFKNITTLDSETIENMYSIEKINSKMLNKSLSEMSNQTDHEEALKFLAMNTSHYTPKNITGNNLITENNELVTDNIAKLVAKDSRLTILEKVLSNQGQLLESDHREVHRVINVLLECSTIIDDGEAIATSDTHEDEMNKFREIVTMALPVFENALANAHEARSMKLEEASIYLRDSFGSPNQLNGGLSHEDVLEQLTKVSNDFLRNE